MTYREIASDYQPSKWWERIIERMTYVVAEIIDPEEKK